MRASCLSAAFSLLNGSSVKAGSLFPSVSPIPTASLGNLRLADACGTGVASLALLPAQTPGSLWPGWASVDEQLFASAPFQVDNAYWLWTFQGRLLQKNNKDRFCQLLWRPRPPTLLSQDQIKVWCPQQAKGLWKRCGTQKPCGPECRAEA